MSGGVQPLAFEFFGVRGSYPVAGSGAVRSGGNTPCVMVDLPDGSQLVIDAGTGIIAVGRRSPTQTVRLFLSHMHWDHIQGLPFYRPLYDPQATVTIYCNRDTEAVRRILRMQMTSPTFPIELADAGARLDIISIGDGIECGGATLKSVALNHPGGCSALRIDAGGRSLVYASDHEAGNKQVDDRLVKAVGSCDALILDAQYDVPQRSQRVGWGHSSWQEAVDLAGRAEVGQLYMFHHDPERDDDALEAMHAMAREAFDRTSLAVEGMRVVLD